MLSVGLKNIHEKWPEYRCNPMMMPFAATLGPPGTDTTTNFSSCIQTMQKGVMGSLLEPVHYATSLATNMSGGLGNAINDVRMALSSVKDMITGIVKQIFAVFMGILSKVIYLMVKVFIV